MQKDLQLSDIEKHTITRSHFFRLSDTYLPLFVNQDVFTNKHLNIRKHVMEGENMKTAAPSKYPLKFGPETMFLFGEKINREENEK